MNDIEVVRCNNCKTILNEPTDIQPSERTPCPSCGSTSRDYKKEVSVDLGIVIPKAQMKAKHGGKGRPFIEQHGKRELYRKTDEHRDITRIIDRENNIYTEIITGKEMEC